MNAFGLSLGLVLITSLVGCNSKSQLKALLSDNPDILIEAFEKNPGKFADAFNKVNAKARQDLQAKNQVLEDERREADFKNPKTPELNPKRAYRGNVAAPVTIVVYSDFQCPFCRKGEETVKAVLAKYGNKTRVIFKHLPLKIHPEAMAAAQRFEAIALQSPKKAYEFLDEVFENQDKLNKDHVAYLDKAAAKVGANLAKMKKDLSSVEVRERIEADMKEAKGFQLGGTPSFLVNGVALVGAQPLAKFEAVIDRHLGQSARDVSSK